MVGREEVFEYSAQYPLFRYSIPMLPEAAQFGGTPACQWSSGLELFLPRIRRAKARRLSHSGFSHVLLSRAYLADRDGDASTYRQHGSGYY